MIDARSGHRFAKALRHDQRFRVGEAKQRDLAIPNFTWDRQQKRRGRGSGRDGHFVFIANAPDLGLPVTEQRNDCRFIRASTRVRRRDGPLRPHYVAWRITKLKRHSAESRALENGMLAIENTREACVGSAVLGETE